MNVHACTLKWKPLFCGDVVSRQFSPGGSSTAAASAGTGGPIITHAGQQQGSLSLPRALRGSPSPPPLGGAAWSQGVGVASGAVGGELGGVGAAGPGGGGGGGGGGSGTIPWDDDYRALRARLEVPSLGFGSLRAPGKTEIGNVKVLRGLPSESFVLLFILKCVTILR